MLALRFHGNRDLRVDEIPKPELKPGWVLVKNAWAGICGSDLHEYVIGPANMPVEPHILTGETIPSVIGHEFSGTIEAVGEGVDDLSPGQKVAVFPVLTDGTCYWCQQNTYGMCDKWGFLGYSGWGGGMAQYVCVQRREIHVIPDSIPLDVAALVEPLAVGWHAVKKSAVKPGDLCLVLGAGPIGLAVVHCLRAHGIEAIVVSEPSPARAAQAAEAGAQHVLNPIKEDVPAFCQTLGDKRGVHAVFDCAGLQQAFDVGLASARGKGQILQVAIYEGPLTIKTPNVITRKQINLVGSNIYTREEFQEVIDAIASGQLKEPEKMITSKIPLRDAVSKGFEELLKNKDRHIKILIDPHA
ncbi:chlorophyll synthesis pathway protein BchC [Fonsecaea pedrosoi CBS 271.37]|uniref:Chlorophyll synthesis pathway protein BchC n=1 Tax=Fonsecaea pedrosoi CBS 271.37 TaxID=1442368 RepID=A0A0D2GS30_9EURO|nr:chlorophyll synthesis pathway protein BchC [Fonsecaea pedrosoi CBS 271.37]KAH0837715.1 (R,R)-butanediol dehydrogenase [Fonsecaea pedrosoi]KIW81355.1 chlorophyll synthesis pathway protein BchC [Fonsecaea pedrosoi CBS 271.37]